MRTAGILLVTRGQVTFGRGIVVIATYNYISFGSTEGLGDSRRLRGQPKA